MSNRTEVLVSHNGIPSSWPGRIELWLVDGQYEVRGDGEVFIEGSPAFECLLNEATMCTSNTAPRATKMASTDKGLELWKVRNGDEVHHEVRTPEGMVYPDHSTMFQGLAAAFSLPLLTVFGLPN